MGIIRCAENCFHQKDGYCRQDEITAEKNLYGNDSKCIYYKPNIPENKENDAR